LNTYGINSRLASATGNDANKLTKSGIYYITPNTANMPANSSYNIMLYIRASGGNDGVQLSIGISNTELYYRKKLNGVWAAWKTI
jgi:hypothetical protein